MQSIREFSEKQPSRPTTLAQRNTRPYTKGKFVPIQRRKLSPNPWNGDGNENGGRFRQHIHG